MMGFSVTSGTAAIPGRFIVVALGGIVVEEWDELWKWTQKQRIACASAIEVVESTTLNWRIVVVGQLSSNGSIGSGTVFTALSKPNFQVRLPFFSRLEQWKRRSKPIAKNSRGTQDHYPASFIPEWGFEKSTKEIAMWRRSQLKALPQLEDLLGGVNPNANAEEDCLFLPSDVSLDERKQFNMDTLTSIERDLREEQANVAITSLCNSIHHGMAAQDAKKEHARGVYHNTRATSNIRYMVLKRPNCLLNFYSHVQAKLMKLLDERMEKHTDSSDEFGRW
ncbi:hypothetical protein BDN70DRAFT_900770 [Pholiota conissans]|uniref:Uncharacterized protein n=1 Tax=Pholiota conissans TaxID=109636 RepID=A0A9P5YLR7_9AGAR|nr:hypothetical protein BDN70DRAFT_900770 [Pholiota conissans]